MKRFGVILLLYFFGLNAKALNVPTYITPINGSNLTSFTVTITASQVNGATGYQFQLDTVASFNSVGLWTETAASRVVNSPVLRAGKTFYWRVRCFAPNDTSIWSNTFSFNTVLGTTQIISPANNSNGPIVEFRAIGLGQLPEVGYLFEIDTVASMNSGFKVTRITPTNQFIDSTIFNYGRKLFWRARAFNNLGDTLTWSAIRNYTIHAMPTINGNTSLTNVDPQTTISWLNAGLSTIILQIDTSNLFNSSKLEEREIVAGRTVDTLRDLSFGKDYFYRIKLKFGSNETNWSVIRHIRIISSISGVWPSNGTNVNSISPIFTWQSVNGVKFQIELYSDSALTQLLKDTITNGNNFPIINTLQLNRWYSWKLRAFHAKDTLPWYISYFKSYNGMVGLGSPFNNDSNVNLRAKFTFKKVPWATSHVLEIDTGSSFSSSPSSYFIRIVDGFYNNGMVQYSSYVDTTLKFNQKYVWRVYALNNNNQSEPNVRTFTTIAAPKNYTPSNNSKATGTQIYASIVGIPGSKWIAWELDSMPDFSSSFKITGINEHTLDATYLAYAKLNFPTYLNFHTKYYWRAKCINDFDTSSWSIPFNFTTTGEVELSNPNNNQTNLPEVTTLRWYMNGVLKQTGFQYQLATDSNFVDAPIVTLPVSDAFSTTVNCNTATTYYWRVRAYNEFDTSRWSKFRRFSTNNPTPIAKPNLIWPENRSINVPSSSINFSWGPANNASEYELVMSIDSTFNNTFYNHRTTNTYSTLNGFLPKSKYFWRVRGVQGAILGPWSEERWFETASLVGVNETKDIKGLVMFPNPAQDIFTVSAVDDMRIFVLNIQGKTMLVQTEKTKETSINIAEWPNGMYFIKIETDQGSMLQKLIINH